MTVQPLGSAALPTTIANTVAPARQAGGSDPAVAEVQKVEQARRVQATDAQATRKTDEVPSDPEELEKALEAVRNVVEPVARNLQFSIDKDTGRTLVKVVDTTTDEVIRQIPSEEILSIAKALDKLKGLLIKQEA